MVHKRYTEEQIIAVMRLRLGRGQPTCAVSMA